MPDAERKRGGRREQRRAEERRWLRQREGNSASCEGGRGGDVEGKWLHLPIRSHIKNPALLGLNPPVSPLIRLLLSLENPALTQLARLLCRSHIFTPWDTNGGTETHRLNLVYVQARTGFMEQKIIARVYMPPFHFSPVRKKDRKEQNKNRRMEFIISINICKRRFVPFWSTTAIRH